MKAVALSKSKDNNLHCKKLTAVVLGKSKDNNFHCKKIDSSGTRQVNSEVLIRELAQSAIYIKKDVIHLSIKKPKGTCGYCSVCTIGISRILQPSTTRLTFSRSQFMQVLTRASDSNSELAELV